MTRLYEAMFLLDNQVVREDWNKAKGIVTDTLAKHGAKVISARRWDERKLAYPIAKHQKGHYLRLNYLSPATLVAEIERRIRIEDSVVRFMTVRLADAVDVPTRIEQAAVQRAQREEEMKRRAAEAALGIDDDDDEYRDDDDDDDVVGVETR